MVPDGMGKPSIEPGKIDADNGLGLTVQGQPIELMKQATEFEIVLQRIGQADDGMTGEIESQIDTGTRHPRATGAKKTRLEACPQWLGVAA